MTVCPGRTVEVHRLIWGASASGRSPVPLPLTSPVSVSPVSVSPPWSLSSSPSSSPPSPPAAPITAAVAACSNPSADTVLASDPTFASELELAISAASARDAERLHIARELHDVAGHKLTALKLNLVAQGRASGRDDTGGLDLCARLVDELLGDIRSVVARMRHDEGLDLRAALAAMAAPFPCPRTHLEIDRDARAATLAQAEALLRMAQEALTNAARHSQARNLWLVLRRDGDRLQLDIRDDGRGTGELRPGNGLSGMRERLEAAGGGLALERTGTGGVHLMAWVPAP